MKYATTTFLSVSALILSFFTTGALADGAHPNASKKGAHDDSHAAVLGQPGDPKKVSRTINVEMTDTMRFNPSSIKVKRGETIKFVAKNIGKIKHEMVLGTAKELKEHAEMMRKMPGMEHDDANQVAVEPGKAGEFVWQFTKAGTFDFACLEPGHFEAGMVGKVTVAKAAAIKQPSSAAK
jgi:uncharacterized cupredoxin-like copper-binding protein